MEFCRAFASRSMSSTYEDMAQDELEVATTSTAVLLARVTVEEGAKISLLTTLSVIVLILLGIVVLTKDLNFLTRSLLRPLRNLAEDMQTIVQMQYAALAMDNQDTRRTCAEIRMINDMFTNMKRAIKSWGKYVPWPVVRILLTAGVDDSVKMRMKDVTIFFSDIAGFTTIVEELDPEQSMLLLSRYFNDMSKTIDTYNGIVIEYIGDAILSVFGAPVRDPDHPTLCVKAALEMLRSLQKINHWAVGRNLPRINVRCGIHTGKVLVGNMGFQSRVKYGIVGEETSIPDRLEELNKTYGTNLLISQSTYQRISHEYFVIRPIDFMKFRQRGEDAKTEVIYNVMAKDRLGQVKHKLRPVAVLHRKALKKYRIREFQESATLFREVNEMMMALMEVDEDVAATMMIKRCARCLESPPAPDWEGIYKGT